jgi:hypothetical protein
VYDIQVLDGRDDIPGDYGADKGAEPRAFMKGKQDFARGGLLY